MNLDTDFLIRDEGTIILFTPVSAYAAEFAAEAFGEDAPMFGNAYAVERRFATDIMQDMVSHAFTIMRDD